MATIRDVAKKAGVSISTVSNVMNGKGAVRAETYRRVKAAMRELGYHPSFVAQNLRNNRSKIAGIILPHLDEPYRSMLQGITGQLEEDRYYTLLKLTGDNGAAEEQAIEELIGLGVSGVILVPCRAEAAQAYDMLRKQEIPLVLLERNIAGMDCHKVLLDKKKLMYHAVMDKKAGHPGAQNLLLRYKQPHTSETECEEGFAKAAPDGKIYFMPGERSRAFETILLLLQAQKEKTCCIFTTDMRLAEAAAEAARLAGIEADIFAMTGDEWPAAKLHGMIQPIEQNSIFAGIQAARLLTARIRGEDTEHQTVRIRPKVYAANERITPLTGNAAKTIRMLAIDCKAVTALEMLAPAAERELGVRVLIDRLPASGLEDAVSKTLAQGGEHDIVMLDMPWMERIVNSVYLLDISKELAGMLAAKYHSAIQKAFFGASGRRNIVPMISGIQTLYYRKDIFADAAWQAAYFERYGTPLAAPRNWTEFNHICAFFTKEFNPHSPFTYGTAMAVGYDINLVNEFLPRQWVFHGKIMDEWGGVCIDDDAGVRAR